MELKAGYKKTDMGMIPEDWDFKPIGGEIDLLVGFPFPSNQYSHAGIKLLRGSNIKRGVTEWSEDITKFWPQLTPDLKSYLLSEGDLVIAMDGSLVGRSYARLTRKDIPALLLQRVARIRSQRIDVGYLTEFVGSDLFVKYCDSVKTVTAIPHISSHDIRNFSIPIPPTIEEQHTITAALSDVDALIAALDRLIDKKCDIKQAAMQELLTGKKRLPGFSGDWRTCLLGEVIMDCNSGATPYRGHPDYYRGRIKWITSGELNYNRIFDTIEHITEEAVQKTNLKVHPVGTFLMAITGLEATGTRGACGIIGSPATTNQSCMAIYPTSELKTDYLYHYYVFRGNALALRYCQGTKQQSYTAKLVRILPIDLPPTVEEQTAIAAILFDMDAEISALEARREKTRNLKQGMMQELLTGRIRLA